MTITGLGCLTFLDMYIAVTDTYTRISYPTIHTIACNYTYQSICHTHCVSRKQLASYTVVQESLWILCSDYVIHRPGLHIGL